MRALGAVTHLPPPAPAPAQRPTARGPGIALQERELAQIWQGQRFPADALVLADGRRLTIVYRGRPGRGPGPDFRDAVIALPDQTLRHGDIELHVRASDFVRHGHDRDPAYDRVVLHVVFYHDGGPTLLRDGSDVLTIALAPWVARRAGHIESWLSRPPLWQEPCHRAVERLGVEEVRDRLTRLGQRRLQQKTFQLSRRLREGGVEDTLYRELLEAVGYGPNREVFRRLGEGSSWLQTLENRAALMAAADRLLFRAVLPTRPGTGFEPRLQGALALLDRFATLGEGSLERAFAVALRQAESGEELITGIVVRAGGQTLIGRGRAAEVAVNVLLPAGIALSLAAARTLEHLYATIPDPGSYGLTAFLEGILRRQDGGLLRSAAERQGLLLLQTEYCNKGHCGSCPLSRL